MDVPNLNRPYRELEHEGIDYSCCRDFDYISRYRGLRQVVHNPDNIDDRYVSLETPNPFISNDTEVIWHEVLGDEINRLDLLANRYLGSAQYSWVIAYFNGIEDGYSCHLGQKLKIPTSITDLMNTGEILQSVTALTLNLGSE